MKEVAWGKFSNCQLENQLNWSSQTCQRSILPLKIINALVFFYAITSLATTPVSTPVIPKFWTLIVPRGPKRGEAGFNLNPKNFNANFCKSTNFCKKSAMKFPKLGGWSKAVWTFFKKHPYLGRRSPLGTMRVQNFGITGVLTGV